MRQLSSHRNIAIGMGLLKLKLKRLLWVLTVVPVLAAALSAAWLFRPLVDEGQPALELAIEPGMSPRAVAAAAVSAGARAPVDLLWWWFRLSGDARRIRAGNYDIPAGTNPVELLGKLVRGDESLKSVSIIDGWNFRQVRDALARAADLQQTLPALSDAELMARLGKPGVLPEGRFFPDRYTYGKNTTDMAVLRRALHAMDGHLERSWAQRRGDTPLRSPDDALILASIVEKETGRAADRGQIAGVFTNRLRMGMRLQTDPTVIYGLGDGFDGNLRRHHLQTDTPWNTYTRAGLPPTPIAMPGKAALLAAVRPDPTQAVYFVARGDGTSQFSATLDEHNRAVNRYQRKLATQAP
jgi:UPF0755 protein